MWQLIALHLYRSETQAHTQQLTMHNSQTTYNSRMRTLTRYLANLFLCTFIPHYTFVPFEKKEGTPVH